MTGTSRVTGIASFGTSDNPAMHVNIGMSTLSAAPVLTVPDMIKHSGDPETRVRFDTGTVKVETTQIERLRIGPSGQIGLSGANYGASGQVLKSQGSSAAPVWGGAGLTSVSQWRLNTNRDIPAGVETVLPVSGDAWYEMDNYGYGRLGSAMTQSSGVFTFPSTGIWRIEFTGFWGIGSNGSANSLVTRIQVTENNSSFSSAHEQQNSINSSSTYTYQGFYNTHIFDVTDTSTHKVRFTRLSICFFNCVRSIH